MRGCQGNNTPANMAIRAAHTVVLGDSVSAGQYLPSNDDAYPRLLATDLHARCHSSAHVFSLLL